MLGLFGAYEAHRALAYAVPLQEIVVGVGQYVYKGVADCYHVKFLAHGAQ
ncbi:MAG: hypothetical protein BroJett014_12010 [Planctomycetota bacterium]|nr:MAG: hypothetical protein BroJett014_12010 [Planctomycetota bacterium]